MRWEMSWEIRWVERWNKLRDELRDKMRDEMRDEMVFGANSELKTSNFFFNTTRVIPNGKYQFIVAYENVP